MYTYIYILYVYITLSNATMCYHLITQIDSHDCLWWRLCAARSVEAKVGDTEHALFTNVCRGLVFFCFIIILYYCFFLGGYLTHIMTFIWIRRETNAQPGAKSLKIFSCIEAPSQILLRPTKDREESPQAIQHGIPERLKFYRHIFFYQEWNLLGIIICLALQQAKSCVYKYICVCLRI